MNPLFDDPSHRYAPDTLLFVAWDKAAAPAAYKPVAQAIAYPPHHHPKPCAIRAECTAVQLLSVDGLSRWYGCERAYINSELRMVLVGHCSRDEVRQKWAVVPAELQA